MATSKHLSDDLTEHELRALNSKNVRAVQADAAFQALLRKAHPDRAATPDEGEGAWPSRS